MQWGQMQCPFLREGASSFSVVLLGLTTLSHVPPGTQNERDGATGGRDRCRGEARCRARYAGVGGDLACHPDGCSHSLISPRLVSLEAVYSVCCPQEVTGEQADPMSLSQVCLWGLRLPPLSMGVWVEG